MFYYLRHLDWDKIRSDCGFRDTQVDQEWDIAISFAGENRDLAKFIAEKLRELDVSVYFDEYYETNYLGKRLGEQFEAVFSKGARYVVCLLDKNHKDKIWPTFERDTFTHRVKENAVIPIYLDNEKFVGISADLYGIEFKVDRATEDWRALANERIVLKLIDKLS